MATAILKLKDVRRGDLAVWGMGAAIADGRFTPDRYTIEREGLKLREKRIAEKHFMVPPRLTEGRKERLQALPHEKRHQETLSPDLVRTVQVHAGKAKAAD